MRAFDERARGFTEYLQRRAGDDPAQDKFYSGYITCVMDLLQVELEMGGK